MVHDARGKSLHLDYIYRPSLFSHPKQRDVVDKSVPVVLCVSDVLVDCGATHGAVAAVALVATYVSQDLRTCTRQLKRQYKNPL